MREMGKIVKCDDFQQILNGQLHIEQRIGVLRVTEREREKERETQRDTERERERERERESMTVLFFQKVNSLKITHIYTDKKIMKITNKSFCLLVGCL